MMLRLKIAQRILHRQCPLRLRQVMGTLGGVGNAETRNVAFDDGAFFSLPVVKARMLGQIVGNTRT